MPANRVRAEEKRLAREILEQLDTIGDSTDLTGHELVQFDLRRNEILEETAPLARMLAVRVLARGRYSASQGSGLRSPPRPVRVIAFRS
jgi:hypothetical protein